jgi:hypothetical protein
VKSPDRSTTKLVPNKPINEARRALSPIKCLVRDQTAQFNSLMKISREFARVIQSTALSKREAWTAYFSFYLPKMTFVLNTLFLSEKQLLSIQKHATRALFRKCGFNGNTVNAVKFDPPRIGGIGLRFLYTEQSLLSTCMLVKHLRIVPGQAHLMYQIMISWAQLATGVGFPILEFPESELPTLEDAFLIAIRASMTKLTASLRLHNNLIRPLAREGVFYLIERLQAIRLFTPKELLLANYCRLYLGVYQASDVVEQSGSL